MDTATVAVHHIHKIFRLLQECGGEISQVEDIYGLSIRQQARNDKLETALNDLMFLKDQDMERLRDENDFYKANACQFEHLNLSPNLLPNLLPSSLIAPSLPVSHYIATQLSRLSVEVIAKQQRPYIPFTPSI